MEIGAKIRRLRKLKGLTIEALADGAELTKGFISQVERDKTTPTVLNLKQIVEYLGVDLATFFTDFEKNEKHIFTPKDRQKAEGSDAYQIYHLLSRLKYLEMSPLQLVIQPQAAYDTAFGEDEGFGYILKGKLELRIDDDKQIVSRGDCFYIFFDNKLYIKNLTNKPAEILLVNY